MDLNTSYSAALVAAFAARDNALAHRAWARAFAIGPRTDFEALDLFVEATERVLDALDASSVHA